MYFSERPVRVVNRFYRIMFDIAGYTNSGSKRERILDSSAGETAQDTVAELGKRHAGSH